MFAAAVLALAAAAVLVLPSDENDARPSYDSISSDGFMYQVESGRVCVYGCTDVGPEGVVVVPSEIDGMPVIGITPCNISVPEHRDCMFTYNDAVKKIVLPSSVNFMISLDLDDYEYVPYNGALREIDFDDAVNLNRLDLELRPESDMLLDLSKTAITEFGMSSYLYFYESEPPAIAGNNDVRVTVKFPAVLENVLGGAIFSNQVNPVYVLDFSKCRDLETVDPDFFVRYVNDSYLASTFGGELLKPLISADLDEYWGEDLTYRDLEYNAELLRGSVWTRDASGCNYTEGAQAIPPFILDPNWDRPDTPVVIVPQPVVPVEPDVWSGDRGTETVAVAAAVVAVAMIVLTMLVFFRKD